MAKYKYSDSTPVDEPTTGQRDAMEYSKKVYEESPYADADRDRDMRNKFNAALNTAGAGRGKQGGPTAKQAKPAPKPAPKKDKDYVYPDSTPVADSAGMKHGGKVKKMASGGSASSRADGIAAKGKTRGRMC